MQPVDHVEVQRVRLRWAWRCALGVFILAGLTGALYRFAVAYGFTAGLNLVNIRHAHSHLMYFGWVTPALMALISLHLPRFTGRPVSSKIDWIVGATFGAALLAYPFFLLFGYTPVPLGAKRLPLSVIAASLNMLVWYVFVGFYVRATRGTPRNRAMLCWDAALTFLVFATLGAWGLALLKPLGLEAPALSVALTHVFLDLFSEGWFVLGVLGLLYAVLAPGAPPSHWSLWLICLGLPPSFALAMPPSLVPPVLKAVANVGGVLVGAGLLANAWMLGRHVAGRARWVWLVPLVLLALKALGQGIVSAVPGVWWAGLHGLRILYLHLMLLGFVTLALVGVAGVTWGRAATAGRGWIYAAVLVLLASLLPLTTFWPAAWGGRSAFVLAAWLALGPVFAVIYAIVATTGGRGSRESV